MPLTVGARLGPYEILAPAGAGGMGEVYKARDTRLERTVAIKVLPQHIAADPEVRQRFEREAKTLASLSHAHICPVFDVGHQDGVDFLVMEYLEGETLAQRLDRKGALPLEDALRVAIDVADALARAHQHGIVHRDLKPGNIMLTKAGARLMDFGLAKLGPSAGVVVSASMSPTQAGPMTAQGTILGTLQYMAPEQLEGQDTDSRTDIFAFGATVYEMVTGKKAFTGTSQASLIGAILRDTPPPLSTLQPVAPTTLDRVVKKCLNKDPDDRWQSASDLKSELQWLAEPGSRVEAGAAPGAGRRSVSFAALGAALLVVALAGVAVWSFTRPGPAASTQPVRLSIPLPPWDQFLGVALSPDGQSLVFGARRGATQQLYRRALDQLEAVAIPGTEGGSLPFFSPDGGTIGFVTPDSLAKIPLAGGAPVTVVKGSLTNGSWGDHDRIVLERYSEGSSLYEVSSSGGALQMLTTLASGEIRHASPQILPGGTAVLYGVMPAAKIVIESLETKTRHELVDGTYPRYVPSGHIIFVREGSIWAVPFDLARLAITGPAVPVVNGVVSFSDRSPVFTVSGNGTLVYLRGEAAPPRRLVWVDASGRAEPIPGEPRLYNAPRISHDGQRVAVSVQRAGGSNTDIWIHDLVRETTTQLSFDPAVNNYPIWTRDDRRIVFSSTRAGPRNLFSQASDGTGQAERLTTSPLVQSPWTWSKDGSSLIFQENDPATAWDLSLLATQGDRRVQKLMNGNSNELSPRISPGGEWIAYHSNESGRNEVYVRPFPNVMDGKWKISEGGVGDPSWSHDGKQLFFLSLDGRRMMAAPITLDKGFSAGKPKTLFEGEFYRTSGIPSYDVGADGRFLMIKAGGATESASVRQELIVVLNWLDEVKRLAPAR